MNIHNNVQIRAPVSPKALCQLRLHEEKPGRLSQTGLEDWWYSNTGLPLGLIEDSYEETHHNVDNLVSVLL